MGESASGLGEKFAGIKEKLGVFITGVQNLWAVVQPVVQKIGEIFKLVFQVYLGAVIGAAVGNIHRNG